MFQAANAEVIDPSYKSLFKLGGAAALIAAVLTLSEVIVFILFPQPGTIRDWFSLFQNNRVIGLLDFWWLEVPMYLMFALAFLALYVVLRKTHSGYMAIALMFAILGIGIFLATNNPFSMLSLSNQYLDAATEEQRSTLLSAGQVLLANTGQRAVGGFNMGLFLISLAGLTVSLVMLRGREFSRSAGYIGIVAHTLSLADYLRQALTSSAVLALLVILPNALFLVVWYILTGRRLYQFGQPQRRPQ